MTEIEQKALALVNEYFYVERRDLDSCDRFDLLKALCLSIEQHEAFKREVSDAVELAIDRCGHDGLRAGHINEYLGRFILPKPVDPLVEVMQDCGFIDIGTAVDDIRAALAKRGLEVREIEG